MCAFETSRKKYQAGHRIRGSSFRQWGEKVAYVVFWVLAWAHVGGRIHWRREWAGLGQEALGNPLILSPRPLEQLSTLSP